MDGPRDYHRSSEGSQTEKNKPHMISFICRILKKLYKWTYLQNRNRLNRVREQTYGYQEGRAAGRDRLGVWDWHVHTAIFRIDKQQGPSM